MVDGRLFDWSPWPPHLNRYPCHARIPPTLTFGGKKKQIVERVQGPPSSRGLGLGSWKAECPIWRLEWQGFGVAAVVDSLDMAGGHGLSMGGGWKNLKATMGDPVNGDVAEDDDAEEVLGWPTLLKAK